MRILVLNGPNLNLLGVREPGLYGTVDYDGLLALIQKECDALGVEVRFYQAARLDCDGIVLNPGAYTHTSIAILDALKAVALPAAEVHITDINQREEFRKVSYAGMACQAHFIGQGLAGYLNAVRWLAENHSK